MDTLRITSKDLKKLSKYELHRDIDNSESRLYLFQKRELLKIFKSTDKDYLTNKLFILNRLLDIKPDINIPELVLPNELAKVSGIVKGYTMDFIEKNTNLGLLLKNPNISLEDKIYFIIKIGKVLNKIMLDKTLNEERFYLGDIHEGNFIYDNSNNLIKVVDIDSAYIPGMEAPNSKFLTLNDKLLTFNNKYPIDKNEKHIPNNNTTILSYIYILLNFLTEEYSPDMDKTNFCNNLTMLSQAGFNRELLDAIFNIYKTTDNYFDFEILKTIEPKLILKYREIKNAKK